MVAGTVVLVVGGIALSRDYGVQSIPPPPDLEEIATPTTSSTTVPSETATSQTEFVGSRSLDWMYEVRDIDVALNGLVYVAGGAGVASLDSEGDWTLLDIDGLPEGTGTEDGYPGRVIDQITIGPDGTVWLAGMATSHADDEQFGGIIDGWTGWRILWWVARNDGCDEVSCSWSVMTSNEVPELEGGLSDAVAGRRSFHALVDGTLLVYDGAVSASHRIPTGWLWSGKPWTTFSMTVDRDGIWWAANSGSTLITFDGTDFTEHTVEDGLLDDIYQVTAGLDGTIWVATDPNSAEAAGVAAFDGTSWTIYTTADGLLSNHAVIAPGSDGTVWAVHSDDPPYGYSRFDGVGWSAWEFDLPVGDRQAAVAADGTLWTKDNQLVISFDGITRTIYPAPFTQGDGSLRFTPLDWGIILESGGPGIHTVLMVVDARPLTAGEVEDVSGRLIWDETVVDLCRIDIRHVGRRFLHVGDIFETLEGCGTNPTAMQDAFDEFGLPTTACVTVTVGGFDHEYCEPLPLPEYITGGSEPGTISVGSEPGTITVVLDGLEGFQGLVVDAWVVVPIDPSDQWLLGQAHWPISADPYSASRVLTQHPYDPPGLDETGTALQPGTYRFIIEGYVPWDAVQFGCEMEVEVVEDKPLIVTLSSIPTYTGTGIGWAPLSELEYPDCPN
jgi:hypothetical protein